MKKIYGEEGYRRIFRQIEEIVEKNMKKSYQMKYLHTSHLIAKRERRLIKPFKRLYQKKGEKSNGI